jgi:hypothetical protein
MTITSSLLAESKEDGQAWERRFHDFRLVVLYKRRFVLPAVTLHRNGTERTPRSRAHLNVKSSCNKAFSVAVSAASCVWHSRVEPGRVNCYCAQGGAVKANTHRSRSCDVQQAPVTLGCMKYRMLRKAVLMYCQLRCITTAEVSTPQEDWRFSRSPHIDFQIDWCRGSHQSQRCGLIWERQYAIRRGDIDYATIPYLRGDHASVRSQHSCPFSTFSNTCDLLHCSSPSAVTNQNRTAKPIVNRLLKWLLPLGPDRSSTWVFMTYGPGIAPTLTDRDMRTVN